MFDAHVHIIDPRFPLVENHGYLPEPFTVADYRARIASLKGLSVDGGAVVTASYQGNDQEYLKAALVRTRRRLGGRHCFAARCDG